MLRPTRNYFTVKFCCVKRQQLRLGVYWHHYACGKCSLGKWCVATFKYSCFFLFLVCTQSCCLVFSSTAKFGQKHWHPPSGVFTSTLSLFMMIGLFSYISILYPPTLDSIAYGCTFLQITLLLSIMISWKSETHGAILGTISLFPLA